MLGNEFLLHTIGSPANIQSQLLCPSVFAVLLAALEAELSIFTDLGHGSSPLALCAQNF